MKRDADAMVIAEAGDPGCPGRMAPRVRVTPLPQAAATAKSAILGLTRSIAVDYAPQIRCVAVCPGTIDTPMLRDAIALSPDPDEVMQECVDMSLLKRIGKPEEVAALIVFLCSDQAAFITGQAIRMDGGLGISIPGSKKDK